MGRGVQESTRLGELMVRKAQSFRSPNAGRGHEKQVLGCHQPCQLLQETGKLRMPANQKLLWEEPSGATEAPGPSVKAGKTGLGTSRE